MKTYIHDIQSERERSATVMEGILDKYKPKAKANSEQEKGQA
jgi:hypothetical protein